jgi:NADP-dependent aldehyde dehydrogenase
MITQNIIGYELSALSDRYIYAANASDATSLPESFSIATKSETDLAVNKAYQAWRIFRNTSGKQRADFLNQIAQGIEGLGEKLVNRIIQETAYPEARILGERNRTCAQLRMFAGVALDDQWRDITIDGALPDRTPAPRPDLRKMMMPLGPVVVFGASNFPLAYSTAGGDVASALAAGCPVIVKAHDSHLGTNALVAEVIMKAAKKTGMPDGVFSSLHGDGFETGKQLVLHPLTAAVGFTGSLQGGRALFDLGQQRPKPIPVFAEMGSVNPIFILPGKIKEGAALLAPQLITSMTMTVGQFCTNPGILVAINNDHTKSLIEELKTGLEKVPEATMLNQGIFKSFHKGVASIREEKGIHMVSDPAVGDDKKVAPILATVPAEVFIAHPNLHHEVFGPFSLLVLCENIDQMKMVAEVMEGQLTSSVFAANQEKEDVHSMIEILVEKAGRIIINGVPTGVEVCAAMTHGGPFPASTDSRFTAVGHHSIRRWIRPVTFQNFPEIWLPGNLR